MFLFLAQKGRIKMKLLTQFIVVLLLSTTVYANKTIIMMVSDDFMWPEYQVPKTLYEKVGFKVIIAGKWKEELRPDQRNKVDYPESKLVKPDITFDEIAVEKVDAFTFVGGNGSWHDFFPNPMVHDVLKRAFAEDKIIGLLCSSAGLLGVAGNFSGDDEPIAKGKQVVGYYKVEGLLKNLGKVHFVDGKKDEVTAIRDGNLITGRNQQSSQKFAEEIVKAVLETE